VDQIISQQTARTMMTLLRTVTRSGTGAAAAQLNHPIGGKTGTTSDFTDAWFLGFSPSVTCGVWVGFDNRESLGEKETGARAALPIWMNIMRVADAGKDDEQFLGEQEESPMLQASATAPAKSAPISAPSSPQLKPVSIPRPSPPTPNAAIKPVLSTIPKPQ
jgi:penicillin-binding protein 1A